LYRFVVKDIRGKDTFLAVADRAGYPAVIAVYTIGKICGQLLQTVGGLGGCGKQFIAIGRSFSYQGFNGPSAFWRFLCPGKIEAVIKVLPFWGLGLYQQVFVSIYSEKSD
jgi:hypothetical protein